MNKKTEKNINSYDPTKPLILDFCSNKSVLSPDSNVPWIVSDNKSVVLKPMILSDYLKYETYNGEKILNYIIIKRLSGQNSIFLYSNAGVYVETKPEEFKGYIRKFIPQTLRTRKAVDEIYEDLICENLFVDELKLNSNEDIINFQDGIFNIRTKKLLPHSPKYLSTIQIPARYSDIAKAPDTAPVFEKYFNTLCNNDEETKKILLECMGLTISNCYGYRPKKALFLIGEGNSGKSQIKSLIESFLGHSNITTVDLKTLNTRFGKMALYNKRLVGCNDMSYETISDMSVFKQATGGDNISIEFKNGGFIDYRYKGFMWFNCNKLPSFGGDKGKWVYDRMIPVYCRNVIPENERDPMLLDKMLLEKNSILKKCLNALYYLINNNFRIDLTPQMQKDLNDYEIENNNFLVFIRDFCVDSRNVNVKTKRSTFNQCYINWCNKYNGGKGKIGNLTMRTILKEKFGEEFKISGGIWYMDKIAITPQIQEELGVYSSDNAYIQ